MSFLSKPIAKPAPPTRSAVGAALMGAAMLATPLIAARADSASAAPTQLIPASAPEHYNAKTKAETVEERIGTLHTALGITPEEEANWSAVAQTMRDNAATMDKLTAEQSDKSPGSVTALDDLKTYEKFAHAHFDGLKNLVSTFETLYASMPDAQKKVADHVFQSFGHEHAPRS